MAIRYNKKQKQNNILYTLITALLLCVLFLTMVRYFYINTESEAYDELHIQTKQIKDDLTLQLHSDRENLQTMANFAAKLYTDGDSYDIMFDSFQPIGLLTNIGILTKDNIFITRSGSIDLPDSISFEEEAALGTYISGRVQDITNKDLEIVRTSVPIEANGEVVGILYGVVKFDGLDNKYRKMAEELDAQLFVYENKSGDFVIDTVSDKQINVSDLKARKYTKGNSYEKMMETQKGYTSFISAYTGEELYIHYSPIESLGWTIMLARPESQVFAKAHTILNFLLLIFMIMVFIIAFYVLFLLSTEKRRGLATSSASEIRKLLLELNQYHTNLTEALRKILEFSKSRSAVFFDANGGDYNYVLPSSHNELLTGEDRKYFVGELLRYAGRLHEVNKSALSLISITPGKHLLKTNEEFYDFLKRNKIREALFASVIDKNNHIGILGVVNPKRSKLARILLEEIAVCFSIAIYNKNHLNRTEIAASTDSLTGVSNRVTYKRDILEFDKLKPENFSCIYIDVNELHLRNNKYGHAAGDEMLLYIANTLKEVFYGHNVYRMGGDEFLVFTENIDNAAVKESIDLFTRQLKAMDYHVAIGVSYRTQNTNTEEMVREAELRMYEQKASYYQNKDKKNSAKEQNKDYVHTKTGIPEIDAMLSILGEHYNGIYRVYLDTDRAQRILMPSYLGYSEEEEHFSKLFTKYIDEMVAPDYYRQVMSFLNYDALKRQFAEGKIPRITYKKTNGQNVILSVYKLGDQEPANSTLWVFTKA